MARRVQDTIYDLLDSFTGEPVSATKVTTWLDGSVMDDTKVDGIIYRKKGSEYFKRNYAGPLNAKWFGVKADGTDITTAAQQAFAFATQVGNGIPVFFPAGTYIINGSLSLSGYSCGILGEAGSSVSTSPSTGTVASGTVFKAINQNGPVLDLVGFISPSNFAGKTVFSNFSVIGDNTANTANKGINIPSIVTSIVLDNILISNTGGICLDLGRVYISDFTNITLFTPVNAKANNVNYLRLTATNGNRYNGLVFRSIVASGDVAASGAINIQGDGNTYTSHDNLFSGCTFEFLHIPTNGSLINCAGNTNIFSDFQFFDCSKELAATGTAVFRFSPSNANDSGGNILRGYIPGRNTAQTDTNFDYGVEVFQKNNTFEGTKGFRGYNVHLNSGVTGTYVKISGSESNGVDPAVIDDSGVVTNTYLDEYLETVKRNSYMLVGKTMAQGGYGLGIQDYTNSQIGYLALGDQGVGFQNAAGAPRALYMKADNIVIRNTSLSGYPTSIAFTGAHTWLIGNGSPTNTLPVGSLKTQLDGGIQTSMWLKEAGTNLGWGGILTTNAKGIANGVCGLNASTLVGTQFLGTGTANTTTYLRGDGTWATATDSTTASKTVTLTQGTGITVTGAAQAISSNPAFTIAANNTTALWNANQLNSIPISGTPTNGQVLQFNGTNYVPATFTAGSVITSNTTSTTITGNGISGTPLAVAVTISPDANNSISIRGNGLYSSGVATATESDPVFTASPAGSITNTNITNWNTAYNKKVNSLAFSGSSTKTLTLTQQDGSTLTGTFTDLGITTETDPIANAKTVTLSQGTGITVTGVAQTIGANPTFTVAAQNTTNIWNAGQINGITVTGTPTTSQVLQYNGTNYVPVTISTGTGTVTSVAVTSADLTVTGSPITSNGTITLTHPNIVTAGTYNNVSVNAKGHVTAGSNVSYLTTETDPIVSARTLTFTAGTGVSITGGTQNLGANRTWTIVNSAPDQTVAITGAGGIAVTGVYPNFTVTGIGNATNFIQNQTASAQSANFNISGTGTAGALVSTGSVSSKINTGSGGTGYFNIQNSSGVNRWSFGTQTVETGSGNVGSNFTIYRYSDTGAGLSATDFFIQRSSGNIGIGTSSPSQKLDVNGNTNITGNLVVTGTVTAGGGGFNSARELKNEIKSFSKSALDIINTLKVTQFKYKADPTNTHIGLVVDESPEELLMNNGSAINTYSSIGILFKAIQELNKKIDGLFDNLGSH